MSEKGKIPQGHISRDQAEQACINAGKRLCTDDEWLDACRGKKPTKFPYGDQHAEGRCNDRGVSGFNLLFGPGNNTPPDASVYTKENMNDPRLNQVEGSVAKAARFEVQKRLQGLRHGRQPPRVDQRPRGHVPGRLLPRHQDQRRGLRLPDQGPRREVLRLLDGLPVLPRGRRAEADRQARQGARQVGEERQVRQGG
ncbi:MAG: SUMF1/EgtB/PvdO family nonheme iron enzyme [Polyangiaceae bacterium]|nr:SUMF1/EgtB/PvdO family nonheme iron enzyme [Polyangiaceae bacterium]